MTEILPELWSLSWRLALIIAGVEGFMRGAKWYAPSFHARIRAWQHRKKAELDRRKYLRSDYDQQDVPFLRSCLRDLRESRRGR